MEGTIGATSVSGSTRVAKRREIVRLLLGGAVGLTVSLSARSGLAGPDAASAPRRRRAAARRRRHSPVPLASGVDGRVLIGPICPVMRADEPCPDRPFAATIVVRDAGGRDVATVRSGADGRFRVALPPGGYTLVPLSPNPGTPPYASPQLAAVEPGRYTFVTVRYDSGIR